MSNERQVNQNTGEIKTIKGTTRSGAFSGRSDGFIDRGVDCSNPIVKVFKRVPTYVATGDKDTDFILGEKVIETEKYNITERANSFKNDSDIYGIMDRVIASGDMSLLMKEPGEPRYADIHDMPKDLTEAGQAIQKGESAYKSLDDAFTKGASMQYIAENFSQKDIDAYISKLKDDANPKPDPVPTTGGDK